MRYVDCTTNKYALLGILSACSLDEDIVVAMNRPIEEVYDWVLCMLRLGITPYIKVIRDKENEINNPVYHIICVSDLNEVYQILNALVEKEGL